MAIHLPVQTFFFKNTMGSSVSLPAKTAEKVILNNKGITTFAFHFWEWESLFPLISSIPPQEVASRPNVKLISLSRNELTSADNLGGLKRLEYLELDRNKIQDLSGDFFDFLYFSFIHFISFFPFINVHKFFHLSN